MRQLIRVISKYHITILKLIDENFPFLVNYLLFGLMKKAILANIKKIQSIEYNQIEFNENKIGIILHDKHELFSKEIVEELL